MKIVDNNRSVWRRPETLRVTDVGFVRLPTTLPINNNGPSRLIRKPAETLLQDHTLPRPKIKGVNMSDPIAELIKKRNDAYAALGAARFKVEKKRLLDRIEGLTEEIDKLRKGNSNG